jgi:hypothetical protein
MPKFWASGIHTSIFGYLLIHRGPYRGKYAHRVYAERQLGRALKSNEVVHHDCRNPTCWPPTDFHLVIMEKVLHDA